MQSTTTKAPAAPIGAALGTTTATPAKGPALPPAKAAGIHGTITLLVAGNPKTPGTKAHARFALYANGMHTNAYRALATVGKQYGGPDLLYDTRHGYIAVA